MELLRAFVVGGAFCAVGQLLIDKTRLTPARILVSFVVAGVVLSALGLYEPILEFGGAGASVPLTGFGNLLAEGTKEAVREKGILGIFTGGLTSCAAGLTATMVFSFTAALFAKSRQKE